MKKTTIVLQSNVPEDLWPEILSRLPVKSLLRFRTVSTSWRAIIAKPDFTRLHLARFHSSQQLESHLLVLQGPNRHSEWAVKSSNPLRTTCRLGSIDNRYTTIVGVVDGLIMLSKCRPIDGLPLLLWNPSIRKTLTLPPAPELSRDLGYENFGLGFDPIIEDYKYLKLVRKLDWRPNYSTITHIDHIVVYTLGTNSWKRIELQGESSSTWNHNFAERQIVLCFRGNLFLIVKAGMSIPSRLVSFDLNSEVFFSTDLPTDDAHKEDLRSQRLTLADSGGSLALVNMSKHVVSIWVMETLGADINSSSWTRCYTFATMTTKPANIYNLGRFLYLKKDWKILFVVDNMVISYDIESHEEKIILKQKLHHAWPYKESLMLN